MGRDALVVRRGADVDVTIKFHSPPTNANGNKPSVNHLDLIVGNVTGPASKGTASWEASTNPTAHVAKTFSGAEIAPLGDNWYVATCRLSNVSGPIYLRLRATNLAPGTPDMTDAAGNPLPDVAGSNTAAKAWGSLWFYSNPIWVEVQ